MIDPTTSKEDRKNIKNLNFVLNRNLPLSMLIKPKALTYVINFKF
jgi:hypothetical protein